MALALCLHEVGLLKTGFWLAHLQKFGLISVMNLHSCEGDEKLYSQLSQFACSEFEKKSIRKLLQIKYEKEEVNDDEINIVDQNTKLFMQKRQPISKKAVDIKNIILISSNGLMLKGILYTNSWKDRLKERSSLIDMPKNIDINNDAWYGEVFNTFLSTNEEDIYKRRLEYFGSHSLLADCESADAMSISISSDKQLLHDEVYASTLKVLSIHAIHCSFEIKNIHFSKAAEQRLQSIKALYKTQQKLDSQVFSSCLQFFEEFGSHVSIGPVSFGGHVLWSCSTTDFSENELYLVLKNQGQVIFSAENIIEHEEETTVDVAHAKTKLAVTKLGGPSEKNLLEWKISLEENTSDSFIITDRGSKYVSVWDIIKMNDLSEFKELHDILKYSWEGAFEVIVSSDFLLENVFHIDNVLKQVDQWNERAELDAIVIQSRLEFLLAVKRSLQNTSKWVEIYISHPSIHKFMDSIVSLKSEFHTLTSLKSLMRDLLQHHELLEKSFPSLSVITNWLVEHNTPSEVCHSPIETYDYDKFISFLTMTIEETKTSSPEHSTISEIYSLHKIPKAIQELQCHYQNTNEGLLVFILINQYKLEGDSTRSFSLSEAETLLNLFKEHWHIIDDITKKSILFTQLKIMNLATNLVPESQLLMVLKSLKHTLENLQPPLDSEILRYLNEYYETASMKQLHRNFDKLALDQSQNEDSEKILEHLGLMKSYKKKLTLHDSLRIRSEIINQSLKGNYCSNPQQIPFIILQKLMSYDSLCMTDLMQQQHFSSSKQQETPEFDFVDDYADMDNDTSEKECEIDQDNSGLTGLNPVDCLLALLLCCDDFLRQDLFSRLAKCQIAIPLILPDPISNKLIIPIWAMRSIIIDWQPSNGGKHLSKSHPMVTFPMPIISFIRFGKHQKYSLSKSYIINQIISEDDTTHFFHRDCRGGQHRRILGDGLVDMTWYLPSGHPLDSFSNPIIFANLHGDAHNYPDQAKLLSEISSICFVFLVKDQIEFDDQDMIVLKKLQSSHSGLVFLNGVDKKATYIKKQFPKSKILDLSSRTVSENKDVVRKLIKKILAKITTFRSIEECSIKQTYFSKDEDCEVLKDGQSYTNIIMKEIADLKDQNCNLKEILLPLQGKSLWQSWAALDKELYRKFKRGSISIQNYTADIEKQKNDKRKEQRSYVDNMPNLMKLFIDTLFKLHGESNRTKRNYFLQKMKLDLNALTRDHIEQKQQEYRHMKKQLSELPNNDLDNPEKIKLQKQMEDCQNDIIDSSLGLEHLLREIGQIYEATRLPSNYPEYNNLAKLVAEILLDGFPLELMDGDASHVPLDWITAVIREVVSIIGNKTVYVLSVLGLQSTGKSTMLNASFGLQFNVSAGRCTRGAFLQIVSLDENDQETTGCNYLLVVDTEGLRAPSLDYSSIQKHDNELATFVIGLADMTLINIYGEVPGDMDDILQTSVHAFLRMNRVKLHPSCNFIHQNASTNISGEVSKEKFTKKLNKFTVDAAKEEHCEGQYEEFNEVIRFDDQTDVHYFPGLWKGNPPMAPVNQGYSHAAQTLKNHVIEIIKNREKTKMDKKRNNITGITLHQLSSKISNLWASLLKENFVFSFKNTLEITAYRSLEHEYGQWDWDFQVAIYEWEHEVGNLIKPINDISMATNLIDKKLEELPNYLYEKFNPLKREMETFFNGNNSEILVQWKASFETKLQNLSDELKRQAEEKCHILLQNKKSISDYVRQSKSIVEKMKLKVQENIQYMREEEICLQENLTNKVLEPEQVRKLLSRDLFSTDKVERYKVFGIEDSLIEKIEVIKNENDYKLNEENLKYILLEILTVDQVGIILKYSTPHENELQKKFDELWEEVVDKIPPNLFARNLQIGKEVENSLIKHVGGNSGVLYSKLGEEKFKNWIIGEIPDFVPEEQHFQKSWLQSKKRSWIGIRQDDEHYAKIHQITNSVLYDAREFILAKTNIGTDFNSTLVSELLREVDKFLEAETSELKELIISFTQEYKIELYIRACYSAIPIFEKIAKKFEDMNNPRIHLEKYERGPLFTIYKNQYQQTETEQAIGDTVCAYLEEPLKTQVNDVLCTGIIDKVKKSGVYYLTNKMALKVKVLADLYKKGDFQSYMVYVQNIKECLNTYMTDYLNMYCDNKMDHSNLSPLQKLAKEKISDLLEVVRQNIPTITEPKLQEWLPELNKVLTSQFGFSMKVESHFKGYDREQELNLRNLRSHIIKQLDVLEQRVFQAFDHITLQDVIEHKRDSYDKHIKTLIGCTKQCPFCGEQCDLNDHATEDQLHRTEVHRAGGLAGYYIKNTQKLLINFCPEQVASENWVFYPEGKEHHYCDYQKIHKDWSITPNATSRSTKYWKWFAMAYRTELASHYNLKPSEVNHEWFYSWEEIYQDLQDVYHVGPMD